MRSGDRYGGNRSGRSGGALAWSSVWPEVAGGNYMGLAHLGADCLAVLPERGCLVGDYALPHLHAGGRVGTVVVEADFIDVGSMREYWRANMRSLTPLGSAPSDDSGRSWCDP